MDLVEVLSFLLMLSTMELGRVCDVPRFLPIRLYISTNTGVFD